MAQQYIKIFDDTILKQSINQGYESQRTNSRLGKFTMGELAFTRDTARLFVGNSTTLELDKDSKETIGGSLVGNKYLGLIDSKPLTHFKGVDEEGNPIATCVHLPLNYETTTYSSTFVDDQGTNFKYEEAGILTADSKFRTDKNNGWDKKATYNPKYDAYNGDFLFDIFNNAIILFDNRIQPVDPDSPQTQWVVETPSYIQKFKKPDGSFYSEEEGKTNFSPYRTRIQNAKEITSNTTQKLGNPNYPIYGNGYVVMRLVEPDGVTLGYVEKQFNPLDGVAVKGNYSHNYIEIKSIPSDTLISSFDTNQFSSSDGVIKFIGETSSFTGDIFPNVINFVNGFVLDFTNATNSSEGYLYCSDTTGNTEIKTAPSITFTINGEQKTVVLKPGTSYNLNLDGEPGLDDEDTGSYSPYLLITSPFGVGAGTESIYAGNLIFDKATGTISAFEEVPDITEKIKIDAESTDDDPSAWFALYDSSGDTTYEIITEEVEGEEDTNTTLKGKFKHPYVNAGYNFLKNPEPIAWGMGNGNQYGRFYIFPRLLSTAKFNSGNFGTIGTVDPPSDRWDYYPLSTEEAQATLTPEEFAAAKQIREISVWDKDYITDIRGVLGLSNLIGVHIPEHAKSVVCEIHISCDQDGQTTTTPCTTTVVTSSDWTKCKINYSDAIGNFDTYDMDNLSLSQIPSLLTDENTKPYFDNSVKILYNYSNEGWFGNDTQQWLRKQVATVEFPLYRDENGMKHFNFGINQSNNSGKWVMRAIGYRA